MTADLSFKGKNKKAPRKSSHIKATKSGVKICVGDCYRYDDSYSNVIVMNGMEKLYYNAVQC